MLQQTVLLKFVYSGTVSAHPDCLSYSPELLAKIDRYTWRCVTCKKCAVCEALLRTVSD